MHKPHLTTALRQFQFLYLGSMGILFIILAFFAYSLEKKQLIANEIQKMNTYLIQLEKELKNHQMHYSKEIYIDTKGYKLGLYDIDHLPIITQLHTPSVWSTALSNEGDMVYASHTLSAYFLGVATIVVAKKIDTTPIFIRLATLLTPLFFIMAIVGWILSRIAFKPAFTAFETIDTFIKHATHDLNTPIAAILSNARILEEQITEASLHRFVQRISIGAKTLTGLYEDLVYLNFQSDSPTPKPEEISPLIHEQLALLDTLIEYKKLSVTTALSETKLTIVTDDFRRLLNNLITNAIKYNTPKGSIILTLTTNFLSIKDSGMGLSNIEKEKIYERYWRGESFETGLGIGMEIVVRVCKSYNLTLEINSTKNQGSEFIIRWPKSLIS
ncbi:MAG: HAMP domain-containing sensor histidine kinase [Campylobacterales bacterium]|nr:HAMP domain-containing sensor histidine kinase [Campylobacterales bacterium]